MPNDQDMYEEEEAGPGIPQADVLKSYVAFGARAIRKRRGLMAAIFFPLLAIAFLAAAFWPRTYHCESTLMAVKTLALEASTHSDNTNPLDGASGMMMRRENLVAIAERTDLI